MICDQYFISNQGVLSKIFWTKGPRNSAWAVSEFRNIVNDYGYFLI